MVVRLCISKIAFHLLGLILIPPFCVHKTKEFTSLYVECLFLWIEPQLLISNFSKKCCDVDEVWLNSLGLDDHVAHVDLYIKFDLIYKDFFH